MSFACNVAVIGGGISGSLFALKLSAARPDWRVRLIEPDRAGRGLAYGACGPHHLLNVPVSRMEVGLAPSFAAWLRHGGENLAEALAESGGRLEDAFVPRRLFGDYVVEHLQAALRDRPNLELLKGSAVARTAQPGGVTLADGRHVAADLVVLALGNIAAPSPFASSPQVIPDPWAPGALSAIAPDARVLMVGTGLTMVDTVSSLRAQGHRGHIQAVSRHGLMPRGHADGGQWVTHLTPGLSPLAAFSRLRTEVKAAMAQAIAWQRVFDAVRPLVAQIWSGWSLTQQRQFLRHLRTYWDVHRHRMADRIARRMQALQSDGDLSILCGRLLQLDADRHGVKAFVRPRHGRACLLEADVAILCTGPLMNLRRSPHPLLRHLFDAGLAAGDALGVGLQSRDCALLDAFGRPSDWLFALGPLTRPAWWEIVAVPEINVQIDRLVARLTTPAHGVERPLDAAFLDMGAGI